MSTSLAFSTSQESKQLAGQQQALTEQIAMREQAAWLGENRAAIDAYNQLVTEHGCFGDAHRSF